MSLEPVQLLQHGPGCRAVLVRQVEEVGQQPQVIQGQGLRCVQRVLLESGHIGAASRVVGPLLLETSWRTTRARRDEERDNTLLGGGLALKQLVVQRLALYLQVDRCSETPAASQ